MTVGNLAAALVRREMIDSSASNLSAFDFRTYASPAAFGSAAIPAAESCMVKSWVQKALVIGFLDPLGEARSDRSESTLTPSTELDDARASHTGEVARAKAIQRIAELKECAQEEQITVNDASQWDLLKFISGYTSTDDLNIFLLDGGTFRVIWKTSAACQVGFEFLGNGTFKRTEVARDLNTGQYSASSELRALQINSGF
jgi:hypothetical protein